LEAEHRQERKEVQALREENDELKTQRNSQKKTISSLRRDVGRIVQLEQLLKEKEDMFIELSIVKVADNFVPVC
jgi:hypothetical protein